MTIDGTTKKKTRKREKEKPKKRELAS